MKKIFAGIGVMLIAVVVYAATTNTFNVNSVSDKSVDTNATEEARRVTADEFNSVVNTMRGISVVENGSKYNMALAGTPVNNVDLVVGGLLKIAKEGSSTTCNAPGVIFYNKDNKHFWGCTAEDGTPIKLDVRECDPVNGACDNATKNTCTTGTLNDIEDDAANYLWECVGIDGGVTDSCSLAKPIDGVCGASHNDCEKGVSGNYDSDSKYYYWDCAGTNGGELVKCEELITYSCVGTSPENANLCTDDDIKLEEDTDISLVAACTEEKKCEYVCIDGYHKDGDKCLEDVETYHSYACKSGAWKDDGEITDEAKNKCIEKGEEYNSSGEYLSGDEVCSSVVPNDDNCDKVEEYHAYTCGKKGWEDDGVMNDDEVKKCQEKGNEYDDKGKYLWDDQVCSSVVPNDDNCVEK